MEVAPAGFSECGLVENVGLFFGGLVFAFALFGGWCVWGERCVGYGCVFCGGRERVRGG